MWGGSCRIEVHRKGVPHSFHSFGVVSGPLSPGGVVPAPTSQRSGSGWGRPYTDGPGPGETFGEEERSPSWNSGPRGVVGSGLIP